MGRVKNPFVGDAVSVAREIKREIPTDKKSSAILSKGGPTTSRLVSLPRIMAVALRANVQFRSIATGRSRGPVGEASGAEGKRGASRVRTKRFSQLSEKGEKKGSIFCGARFCERCVRREQKIFVRLRSNLFQKICTNVAWSMETLRGWYYHTINFINVTRLFR